MPPRIGTSEPTNQWQYDEGFLHEGIDYQTDKSIDDAYRALEASRWDDGQIDTEELMSFIVSGWDYAQYTDREIRQIVNAIRVNWDALTPAAKALGTRFIEEMRPRVPNIEDCSPYALAGRAHNYIIPIPFAKPNNGAPDAVRLDGLEANQLLGTLAGMVGSDVRK